MAPEAPLFGTVAQRDHLQFWQSGLFQPQRVARFLGLSKIQLAKLAGVAPASVRFDDKAPRVLRERMMELAATCALVAEAFDGNATRTQLWFMTANPQLNGLSPCDLLRQGNRTALQRHVTLATRKAQVVTPVKQAEAELRVALLALRRIPRFLGARTLPQFLNDELCQSAIERQLQISGDALGQLRTREPTLFARIPDGDLVVSCGAQSARAPEELDQRQIHDFAARRIPALIGVLEQWLDEHSQEVRAV
jgi:uncharacterized protein with HEPN domain